MIAQDQTESTWEPMEGLLTNSGRITSIQQLERINTKNMQAKNVCIV